MLFYKDKIIYFFQRLKLFFSTFRDCYKDYKLSITILAVSGFFGALFEGVGINALIPLFSFVTSTGSKPDDFISRAIEKLFLFLGIDFKLKYLLLFVATLFVLKAVMLVLSEYIRIHIVADYEERARNNLFKNFLNADWPYLLKQKIGHLQTVLTTNVENSATVLSYIGSTIIIFINLAVYTLVAVNINPQITLFALILSTILFLGFFPFIRKIRNYAYSLELVNRDIGHHVNENIFGMKTIKVMSVIRQVLDDAKINFRKLKTTKVLINVWQSLISSLMQPISLIFVLIIFAFSYKSQNFNLAEFIAVIYIIKQIFSYTEVLQKKVLSFNAAIPFFKIIAEYERQTTKNAEKNMGKDDFIFKYNLKFNNVSFSYKDEALILDKLNFEIQKGEMVGLIGPSGAGKTTIVDIILRLFIPAEGEIAVDGKNVNKIDLSKWRNSIGYVSQDIFLMNDTIANNIKFYNIGISGAEIEEAAKKANIHDFIMSVPDKYDSFIGERGVELSAGQRQRLVIARVLAAKPELLILDEATSALDNESEVKIQEVIEGLKGKITVFVIAHRLSTIINCDRLLVLEGGKIIEEGKPRDLLKDQQTYFYKVYNIRNK